MPKAKSSLTTANVYVWLGLLLLIFPGCASTPKTAAPAVPPTSATAGTTTIVAIQPSPGAGCTTTLPQFLGLSGLAKGVGGVLQRLGSRLLGGLDLTGRFPGLQPQPPVLPLTDPANLEETAPPAVQAAAEIKQEEDAAPQKIMAIRYLATLGCGGCYEKVEDALLEGLSDCTEEVRFEAAKALQCKPECGCKFCKSTSCCSEKVRRKLEELSTCEKEPSARIRRVARLSLACCNSKPLEADDVPREGPSEMSSDPKHSLLMASSNESGLFEGMQLVSFESLLTQDGGNELLIANVNGEPIYESQVLPLVESKMGKGDSARLAIMNASERRKRLAAELPRVIDWKLLEQLARNEVVPAGTLAAAFPLSPDEVRVWFEGKLQYDRNIPLHHISAYYAVHRDEFKVPAKVRWERITVLAERCASREQAVQIGNYIHERALGITKEQPRGFTRDMIESESFAWGELSKIESPLFRNELKRMSAGQVSNPIESADKIHLLRLLERTDDDYLPLPVVADRIQHLILADRRQAAELRLLSQVRSQSQIWTAFDSSILTSRQTQTEISPPVVPNLVASPLSQGQPILQR